MDQNTVTVWLHELGWRYEPVGPNTLRIFRAPEERSTFLVRHTEHWLLLAIVRVVDAGAHRPQDLARRLLAVNRDIHLAKFAYDEDGDVTLNAELPTESLDRSELREAIERMSRYVEYYRSYFSQQG